MKYIGVSYFQVSERLLRPKEVCQKLGISYATLSRYVREGEN